MKKLSLVLILILTISSCQEKQKIAFIDNAKVVNEYQKKKDFEEKFKTKIESFNKKTDSLQQAIQLEAQLFQSRAAKMNQNKAEEEYQALLQKKQMQDYQLNNEEKQLQVEGQKEIDTLVKQVKAFIKDYGKSNGYTFILGANEAGSVLYGSDNKDFTDNVISELNKEKTDSVTQE